MYTIRNIEIIATIAMIAKPVSKSVQGPALVRQFFLQQFWHVNDIQPSQLLFQISIAPNGPMALQ
jgi:hypothetical protein